MKRPIVGLQTKINFSQTLQRVLEFHLPAGAVIVDPTPGEKHSWKYSQRESRRGGFFPPAKFEVVYLPDDISNFRKTKEYAKENSPADAVFFDPPYIFGYKQSEDVRREDYGGYHYTFENIKKLIAAANSALPECLKEYGKLFLKYTDVFSLAERRFYFCAAIWPQQLDNFEAIDHYIVPHHHISPTAWQVKERPCGVVNYTYLTVFRKR